MEHILAHTNWCAVLAAAGVYWILGALWFSIIAGNAWSRELVKHGVTMKEPTKPQLIQKMSLSFAMNVAVAFGVSVLIQLLGTQSLAGGIKLGVFTGVLFSAATTGIAYTWENRSLKLFLIDAAYPVLGITACAVIITLWK